VDFVLVYVNEIVASGRFGMLAKAHFDRDEEVAGSNPATPTSYLSLSKAHPDRYPNGYAGRPRDPAGSTRSAPQGDGAHAG
jgi:hypothetical protein